jgi:hypothetical protein
MVSKAIPYEELSEEDKYYFDLVDALEDIIAEGEVYTESEAHVIYMERCKQKERLHILEKRVNEAFKIGEQNNKYNWYFPYQIHLYLNRQYSENYTFEEVDNACKTLKQKNIFYGRVFDDDMGKQHGMKYIIKTATYYAPR